MSEDAADESDEPDAADDDDGGFDKEAEREKLREKFARDEEKRESTRRMSELLLKGATMTNEHCDNCGSPIFRQNGREFCPECDTAAGQSAGQGETGGQEGGERAAGAEEGDQRPGQAGSPVPDERGDAPAGGAEPPADLADAVEGTREPAEAGGRGSVDPPRSDSAAAPSANGGDRAVGGGPAGRPAPEGGPAAGARESPSQAGRGSDSPTGGAAADRAPRGGADDLPAARDALVAALRRHAEAAANETDPRTARDHLAAAREAAEALSALRR